MRLAGIAHLAQARPGRVLLESCQTHRAVLTVTSKFRLRLTPVLRDVLWNLARVSQGLDDGTTVNGAGQLPASWGECTGLRECSRVNLL
jgi:hypothetical protein